MATGVTACAALLAVVSLGAPAAASDPAYQDPAWSPTGKQIAFVGGTGAGDLYVMNVAGSHLRRLKTSTHENGAEFGARWPTWSPNGRKLAFGYGSNGIWVINADGTGLHKIVADGCCPAWSPGGRRIAYVAPLEAGAAKVWVVDTDGGKPTLVAAPPDRYSYGSPAWSRDGERLAFNAGMAPDCCVVTPYLGIISRYRGRVTRVAVGHTIYRSDWARGGRRILLAQDPHVNNPRPNVWISILDLRTKKIKRIRKLTYGISARWSPDSRRIVFADRGRIYVMNADGSHVRRLI